MTSTYQQLCPVRFGPGAIKEIGEKAKEFGVKKALCVFDHGVKQTGMWENIGGYLHEAGIEAVPFDDVRPETPDTLINSAGKMIYGNGFDLVVGIGGGSSLDTAKALSVLTDKEGPINQYFSEAGGSVFSHEKTKLILVPTAAGTGSEVTIMSVVYDTSAQLKRTILRPADLAILDPELTITLPPHITAATGIDAMSHAVEAFTSNTTNPMSDVLALKAIELINQNIEAAYADGSNLEARTAMCFATNIAGIAFSDASVHFGHCAAHELGVRYNIPHGAACAIALPEVVEYTGEQLPDRAIQIARALGVSLPGGADGKTAATLAAKQIRQLMRNVEIKSLKAMGISREDALSCADGAVTNNWFIICAPSTIDIPEMTRLIGQMYDNYQ